MSIPPIPEAPNGNWWDSNAVSAMQVYGQQCRVEALEEAARICHGIATAPSNVVLGVAMECYEKTGV